MIAPGLFFAYTGAAVGSALLCARSGVLAKSRVFCPLRTCIGIPCGSCGLTRAATAITRGEFIDAARFHLASLSMAAIAVSFFGLLGAEAVTGRSIVQRIWSRWSHVLIWIMLALVVSGWVVNLTAFFGHAQPT